MNRKDTLSTGRKPSTPGAERGQILVVFAVAAVTLILVAGLVVDGGNAFLNRRTGQNVSDLAAVAGTKVIADFYTTTPSLTSADVYSAISARAVANNCASGGDDLCAWTASYVDKSEQVTGPVTATGAIPSSTQGVIVHVKRQPRTFFLGVIGQNRWTVQTDATALTARLTTAPPAALLPIGINPPSALPGTEFTLGADTNYGPGNVGWLSWLGGNATGILAASLCNPDNPIVSIGDSIPGEPGVHNSSAIRACLDQWIASGATILVPLFQQCNPCNGNNAQFIVTGFAAFVLTGYTISHGAINTLTGRFVGVSDLLSVPAGSGNGPPGTGDPSVFLGLIR